MSLNTYRLLLSGTIAIVLCLSPMLGLAQAPEKPQEPDSVSRQDARSRVRAGLAAASAGISVGLGRAARNRPVPEGASAPRDLTKPLANRMGADFWSQARVLPQDTTFPGTGTGSGDINEIEPNDMVAQNVSMPANIVGTIDPTGDNDFYAFQAFAGQQINVQIFASSIGSALIPSMAILDTANDVLDTAAGNGFNDPTMQYIPPIDEILIVGATDAQGFGGSSFFYLLNIEAGVDVNELEPNSQVAQALPPLPVTVFGSLSNSTDVDLYSFTGVKGDTLIADIDADIVGSDLVSVLQLSDPSTGIVYFTNSLVDGHDPRFNLVLPYNGTFVISVSNFGKSQGGNYSLNLSMVSSSGAIVLSSIQKLGKKLLEASVSGIGQAAKVEVASIRRKTTFIDFNTLQASGFKVRAGQVITVVDPQTMRRSNPLLVGK